MNRAKVIMVAVLVAVGLSACCVTQTDVLRENGSVQSQTRSYKFLLLP